MNLENANRKKMRWHTLIYPVIIFVLILGACARYEVPVTGNLEEVVEQTSTPLVMEVAPPVAPTNTLEQIFTPTPDTRIPPEEWQSWPILPEVTNRAFEIYQKGQTSGVNPQSFSKIGDCQNVKESFMGIYDTGIYFLQDWQKEWQQTIDHFKGYYNRDSLAFGQGLNVAATLSPLHADPNVCIPQESPLQCELRVINPAFVFVRFERWYPDVTPPDVYEKYLRQIIDEVIAHGTVPILVTKADNVEGNHQINYIIARLAFEYDLPLYNWWRAAQALPHQGLDPERDDKFHIDPMYAWTEQSAYGLGALDSIWKGITNQ